MSLGSRRALLPFLRAVLPAVAGGRVRAEHNRRCKGATSARIEHDRFSAIFDEASIGLGLLDPSGAFVRVNAALRSLTGMAEDDLLGAPLAVLWHSGTPAPDLGSLVTGQPPVSVEARLTAAGRTAGGRCRVTLSCVVSADGAPADVLLQVESLEERRQLEAHLRRQAEEDHLTGLWNRRRMEEEIDRAVDAAVSGDGGGALILLDLDDFKEVNDGHGHEVGDRLLREVADAVRESAGPHAGVARLGGDEFAVLVSGIAPDEAAVLGEQIGSAIRRVAFAHGGEVLRATASVGVAFLRREPETAGQLLGRADLAMYDAKAAGRERAAHTRTPRSHARERRGTGSPGKSLRVVHCDDSEPYRRLLAEMLRAQEGLTMVGEAATHDELLRTVGDLAPDVIALDLDAARDEAVVDRLRAIVPAARIVVLSGKVAGERDALASAADGFVSKAASFDEIAEALRGGDRASAGAERRTERPSADDVGWLRRIRRALTDDSFVLHAQPIVDIATGETVQHELLLRMRGEDGELVAPGRFLPAAERYGLITEIDRWVITRAVGLAAAGHRVEVNVSGDSLADPDLGALVEREVALRGADPELLAFEITETALARSEAMAAAFVRRVKGLGCSVALDDFGTGYAGFSYLKRLPVDALKIDREFVADMLTDPASEQVVRAVVQLALGMGLVTVAEGVEDQATLDALGVLGVDAAQGFHLGRPAPLPDVLGVMAVAG